jgi:hypothetical protein
MTFLPVPAKYSLASLFYGSFKSGIFSPILIFPNFTDNQGSRDENL